MKIICIGRNYTEHIEELSNERPDEPVVFIKPDSAILPKEQDFYIPEFSNDVHYEVEVLVKIKKVGKHISKKFAHNYYDEIGLGIDFTARDLQSKLKEKGLPWEKAKGFDGAAVIGEWLPKTNFEDLNNIDFSLLKNDNEVQKGNTSLMLWKIDELISYVSQFFMLKKGDVIFTGTPAGVGRIEANDYLSGILGGRENFHLKVK
ncbi:fumarylacetoacetate hydrolase family protein [Zobellia roscoffensis]|uniref:fumarylacetoacetate hydrolase family protein n=1 Tax=Zobellia roscoffensis TaxID=2779508 RepID=UPI00188D43F3|nr:fumarylacetoacetate hydrolase family protein [Zobellia roscoffensis]